MGVCPSGCTPFFIFHTSHTNHKNTQRQTKTKIKIKINPLGRRKKREKEKRKKKKENTMIDVFDFMMDEENGWNEISQEETEE